MNFSNVETVRQALRAMNELDLDSADRFIAPGFVRHDYGAFSFDTRGPEGWTDLARLLLHAFPDLKTDVREVIATDDHAVAYLTACGTHLGEFLGVQPTGQTVCFDGVDLYRLEGGKIAESWPMPDLEGMRRGMGFSRNSASSGVSVVRAAWESGLKERDS